VAGKFSIKLFTQHAHLQLGEFKNKMELYTAHCVYHLHDRAHIRHVSVRVPIPPSSQRVVGFKIAVVYLLSFAIASPLIAIGVLHPEQILVDIDDDAGSDFEQTARPPLPTSGRRQRCTVANRNFLVYGSLVAFFVPLLVMLIAVTLSVRLLANSGRKSRWLTPVSGSTPTTPIRCEFDDDDGGGGRRNGRFSDVAPAAATASSGLDPSAVQRTSAASASAVAVALSRRQSAEIASCVDREPSLAIRVPTIAADSTTTKTTKTVSDFAGCNSSVEPSTCDCNEVQGNNFEKTSVADVCRCRKSYAAKRGESNGETPPSQQQHLSLLQRRLRTNRLDDDGGRSCARQQQQQQQQTLNGNDARREEDGAFRTLRSNSYVTACSDFRLDSSTALFPLLTADADISAFYPPTTDGPEVFPLHVRPTDDQGRRHLGNQFKRRREPSNNETAADFDENNRQGCRHRKRYTVGCLSCDGGGNERSEEPEKAESAEAQKPPRDCKRRHVIGGSSCRHFSSDCARKLNEPVIMSCLKLLPMIHSDRLASAGPSDVRPISRPSKKNGSSSSSSCVSSSSSSSAAASHSRSSNVARRRSGDYDGSSSSFAYTALSPMATPSPSDAPPGLWRPPWTNSAVRRSFVRRSDGDAARNSASRHSNGSARRRCNNNGVESMPSSREIKDRINSSSSPACRFRSLVRKHRNSIRAAAAASPGGATIAPMRKVRRIGSGISVRASVSTSVRSERKAARVLGTVFAVFVICWTPFFAVNLAVGLGFGESSAPAVNSGSANVEPTTLATPPPAATATEATAGSTGTTGPTGNSGVNDSNSTDRLLTVCQWLGYASSTLNPVIYTAFNRTFRRTFVDLVVRCRCTAAAYRARERRSATATAAGCARRLITATARVAVDLSAGLSQETD
jgi:hypothetical protein